MDSSSYSIYIQCVLIKQFVAHIVNRISNIIGSLYLSNIMCMILMLVSWTVYVQIILMWLPLVLYERKTWSLTLGEEHKLRFRTEC